MTKRDWVKDYLCGMRENRKQGKLPISADRCNELAVCLKFGYSLAGYWTARIAGAGLNEDGTPWKPSE